MVGNNKVFLNFITYNQEKMKFLYNNHQNLFKYITWTNLNNFFISKKNHNTTSTNKYQQHQCQQKNHHYYQHQHHLHHHHHHHDHLQHQQQQQQQHHYRLGTTFCATVQLIMMISLIFLLGNIQTVKGAATQQLQQQQTNGGRHEPTFLSRSETFKFKVGETIHLPCDVTNADSYMVAWKRGIAILSAGNVKVTPDPRIRLVSGYSLQIDHATAQDAGDYICQIATLEPREITHTVEILVPPRIHHLSSGTTVQAKKGSTVRIECLASGNPSPNVTWTRKNNILPNGDDKLLGSSLTIESMDRHKGGLYICTANNGVGDAALQQVNVHVLYPPEISVETPIVYSGEGQEAMLVCIVHGDKQPDVIWFKQTMQLDTTERHITETRGSRHTLIIRKVHSQDFGNYTCVAENPLGKVRKIVQLTGKPNAAVFRSAPVSQYKDRYNISWSVDSHAPIEEFKLSFRRFPSDDMENNIDHQQLLHHRNSDMTSGGGGAGGVGGVGGVGISGSSLPTYTNRGYMNTMRWTLKNDWRDVVLPAVPLSHHYTQSMSYLIRGLQPDQQYEARVQSRNRYGWSDRSESFQFSTSINDGLSDLASFLNSGLLSDSEMRDLSVTYYGSSGSKSMILQYKTQYFLGITSMLSFTIMTLV